MVKPGMVIVADYSEIIDLSLDELCNICDIPNDFVLHLIQYEVIHPKLDEKNQYHFDVQQLNRLKTTLRLQRDLNMNFASIAIVLDLLDELHELRKQNELFKKHYHF